MLSFLSRFMLRSKFNEVKPACNQFIHVDVILWHDPILIVWFFAHLFRLNWSLTRSFCSFDTLSQVCSGGSFCWILLVVCRTWSIWATRTLFSHTTLIRPLSYVNSSRCLIRRSRDFLRCNDHSRTHSHKQTRMTYRSLLLADTYLIMESSLKKFLERSHCSIAWFCEVTVIMWIWLIDG